MRKIIDEYTDRKDLNEQSRYRLRNPEKIVLIKRKASQTYKMKNPFKVWLGQTKSRAKKMGLVFNLSLEELYIPTVCPVLGLPLRKTLGGRRTDNSLSLDRIDNSKGYTKENTRIISWRANRLKNNMSIMELDKIHKYVHENN